jgi:rhodanese-related sulfurtransferase
MVLHIWGIGKMSRTVATVALAGAIFASTAIAQTTSGASDASFTYQGQEKIIAQAPRADAVSVARFYSLQGGCDGLCIAPDVAAEGVETITENAVLAFMAQDLANGTGLLIDSRLPSDRAVGFLPASVSIPFSLISPENPLLPDILGALGARSLFDAYNFTDAMTLVVFDAGPTTTDASTLINAMLDAGYPADKIKYYRGGMQVWSTLGLTTEGTSS